MAEPAKRSELEEKLVASAQRLYPWHRAFFVGLNVLLTVINLYTGKPWWGLWPLVITGGLFTLHYLIYKASIIDDEWVDQRAGDLYDRSYDQGHIDSIASHHDMETTVQREEREARKRASSQQGRGA